MPKKIKAKVKSASRRTKGKKPGKILKSKKSGHNDELLDELIERGRSKGFVTSWEILDYFPKVEKDLSFLEEIYDKLEQASIKILEADSLIQMPSEEISKKELEQATRSEEH